MKELYYSALDLAIIISSLNLGCREEAELLKRIWHNERAYLLSEYRKNFRKFMLDVYYWLIYRFDKPAIDAEFPAINRDFAVIGKKIDINDYTCEMLDLDLFFKSIRIKILYTGTQHYVRIKLRTLLKQYGYKRRSAKLLQYINECLHFYHIATYVRGEVECNFGDISLDEMITFRIL